jgi:hypothetical protein
MLTGFRVGPVISLLTVKYCFRTHMVHGMSLSLTRMKHFPRIYIHIHLQRIRKFIKSMNLVDFLDTPKMDRTHQAVTSHYGPKVDEKT